MEQNKRFYTEQILRCKTKLSKWKSKILIFSTLRLIFFIGVLSFIYFSLENVFLLIGVAICLTAFVWCVNKFLDAKQFKEKETLLLELNEAELNTLDGDWSYFQNGQKFFDAKHPFAYDLDLFGEKSMYQLINRTVLPKASKKLARELGEGTKNPSLSNQVISKLTASIAWCQQFIVHAKIWTKELNSNWELRNCIKNSPSKNVKSYFFILTTLSWIAIGLYAFSFLPLSVFVLIELAILLTVGSRLKESNRILYPLQEVASQVNAEIEQLKLIREQRAVSSALEENFFSENGALNGLKELAKIQKRISYRNNLLVAVILNLLYAWDFKVQQDYRTWLGKYGEKITDWEEQLAQVEVWVSGAIYAFNFPNHCFVEFKDEKQIEITELYHPFVDRSKVVTNSASIAEEQHFQIVTGPNMAGKSTYLRSIAWAIASANAGFPVLANECSIPKMKLYSSMRTADDLTVESSYFYAELSRLQFIMEEIKKNELSFVILDEILKGTNSKDKQEGSKKLLQKWSSLDVLGVIATHDLSLTKLGEKNEKFSNLYFDSTIQNGELFFDYKIRPGVCQNMNASFLLDKMELV